MNAEPKPNFIHEAVAIPETVSKAVSQLESNLSTSLPVRRQREVYHHQRTATYPGKTWLRHPEEKLPLGLIWPSARGYDGIGRDGATYSHPRRRQVAKAMVKAWRAAR